VNVVANHHLKLAAAFDHHDHAGMFLEPFTIRFVFVFRFETQPGRAMNQADDVLFAANVAENILRQCLIFHLCFLLHCPQAGFD